MRFHRHSAHYLDFLSLLEGKKSHIHLPEGDYKRGDRVHLQDESSGRQVVRDILTIERDFFIVPGMVGIGLLGPDVTCLRQISVTNERGQTSVLWVGDSRALKVGRHIHLHDSMHDWCIDSLWIALTPENVPEQARIGFVQEIV